MDSLTPNTISFEKDGKTFHILGTAHVSADSREEVISLIEKTNPDSVCVELCESRYNSLKEKDRWKNLDIMKVIRQGKGFLLFANMILHSFQKRIGSKVESLPGGEMIAAMEEAEKRGKKIVLADRDVTVTLKRAWKLSSFWSRARIFEVLIESLFSDEEIGEEEIKDLLEKKDIFNEVMNQFADKLPKVKQVFLDERDSFLAEKIQSAQGNTIVAVVGKGHQNGIITHLKNNSVYDKSIETVPGEGKPSYIPWIITGAVVLVFIAGFYFGGWDKGLDMLITWALVTGTCCGISAIIAMAHPVTILSSWIVAPITTLHPLIGAGMFLALIEAYFRKPRVSDFESLVDDIETVRGFLRNRITKILLVFVITSIGASIGTFVAIPWISSMLGK